MSKAKKLDKPKKPLSPVLKGLLIPILYAIFNVACHIAFLLIAILTMSLKNLITFISHLPNAFDNFLPWLNRTLAQILSSSLLATFYSLSSGISLTALAVFVLLMLIVYSKKGNDLSQELRIKRAPARSVISAILIGIGIGGLIHASYIFTTPSPASPYPSANFIIDMITEELPAKLPEEHLLYIPWYIVRRWVDLHYQFQYSVNFDIGYTIGTTVFQAISFALVFCVGSMGNLKKKMPAFVAVLLPALLFALFSGTDMNLITALIVALLLGLVYGKTNSGITPAICYAFMVVPLTVIYFGQGIVQELMQMFAYWLDFPDLADRYLTVTSIASAVISAVVLIVGMILVLTIKKSANEDQPEVKEPADEPETAQPAEQTAWEDPFAGI